MPIHRDVIDPDAPSTHFVPSPVRGGPSMRCASFVVHRILLLESLPYLCRECLATSVMELRAASAVSGDLSRWRKYRSADTLYRYKSRDAASAQSGFVPTAGACLPACLPFALPACHVPFCLPFCLPAIHPRRHSCSASEQSVRERRVCRRRWRNRPAILGGRASSVPPLARAAVRQAMACADRRRHRRRDSRLEAQRREAIQWHDRSYPQDDKRDTRAHTDHDPYSSNTTDGSRSHQSHGDNQALAPWPLDRAQSA